MARNREGMPLQLCGTGGDIKVGFHEDMMTELNLKDQPVAVNQVKKEKKR